MNKILKTLLLQLSIALPLISSAFAQESCSMTMPDTPLIFQSNQIYTKQINQLEADFLAHTRSLDMQINCIADAQNSLDQNSENFEQAYFLYEDIRKVIQKNKLSLIDRYNFLLANAVEKTEANTSNN